jgi:Protein of unknown function (DUF2934)
MPRTNKPRDGSGESPRTARESGRGNGNGAAEPFNDRESIAKRAYEIYQGRGGQHGADLDDWLEAERQLKPGPGDVTGPAPAKARKRKPSSEQTGL